jgi:hypothetical protein
MMTDEEREDLAAWMVERDQEGRQRFIRWVSSGGTEPSDDFARTLSGPVSDEDWAELHRLIWLEYLRGLE